MMEHMPEHRFLTIPKLLEICEKHDLTLSYAANDDVHTLIIVTKSCERSRYDLSFEGSRGIPYT